MKGIVNRALNERAEPSVNARVTRAYQENDELEVIASSQGDDYDGDDTWHQLKNGNYVWAGAVDLIDDDTALSEADKTQYLISFRKIKGTDIPDQRETEVPDELYFTPVKVSTKESSVRVKKLVAKEFASEIISSIEDLQHSLKEQSAQRKHVVIYIHGFQPVFPSLGLSLLDKFTHNYMTQGNNTIAKLIMMTWPAQSDNRKYIDDRAFLAGQHFTSHQLFDVFRELSKALAKKNMFLNLVVHSFGHQLLNGMLNPAPAFPPDEANIFKNVFLMAPDITYQSVQAGGANLTNHFNSGAGSQLLYKYQALQSLSDNTHVFYDEYDFLLYTSTKKFVSDPGSILQTGPYRNLGNYGGTLLANAQLGLPLRFIDINTLAPVIPPAPLLYYPFQDIRKGPRKAIERVRRLNDYSRITLLKAVFNLKRFPDRHRYLFTHKAVVQEVLKIL